MKTTTMHINVKSLYILKAVLAWLLLSSSSAFANISPVGLWKTVDEETNEAKSYVRIIEQDGKLFGTIEKILNPGKQNAACNECSGAKKGKPILGMTIINGVVSNGDGIWEDGKILDPNNGKTYTVRLTPKNEGSTLEVRGYIGFFYRNQYWQRIE